MKNYRKKQLKKFKSTHLTKESYFLLRKEKPKQKKSIMCLIDELVKKHYGKTGFSPFPVPTGEGQE